MYFVVIVFSVKIKNMIWKMHTFESKSLCDNSYTDSILKSKYI